MSVERHFSNPELKNLPFGTNYRVLVFRHGESSYLEEAYHYQTGMWDPDINDLTESGVRKLQRMGGIKQWVDPELEMAVISSSPRARAFQTANTIRHGLEENLGMSVYERIIIDEMLVNDHMRHGEDHSLMFKETLRELSSLERDAMGTILDMCKGKKPLFVYVTHSTVLYEGKRSFLKELFPKGKIGLAPGDFMIMDFDLEFPGCVNLRIPRKLGKKHVVFQFDRDSGVIERL